MNEYKAKFKCRLCKKEYRNCTTGGKTAVERTLFPMVYHGITDDPMAPKMNEVHYCGDGGIGVADFLGWELQEDG